MSSDFFLIAGPCVIENEYLVLDVAEKVKLICDRLDIKFIFKSSFDKANRSSINTFRGPSLLSGLDILSKVKQNFGLDLLTDVHVPSHVSDVADVVDIIQIPAFLSRQTDLLISVAKAIDGKDKYVNIKKGQFLAPWDMEQVVNKVFDTFQHSTKENIWITERGTTFGYNNLVVDFRSLFIMKKLGMPVIFDATHSVQQPGGNRISSGGQREFVAPLSRAAIAVGVDGLFLEVHPDPNNALSDGPNMVPLHRLENLLIDLKSINDAVKLDKASSDY